MFHVRYLLASMELAIKKETMRQTEIKEEIAVIKDPVTGDKRCAIRCSRRPLEICSLHHMHLSAGGACQTAGADAGFVPSVLGPQEPGGPSLLHRRHTYSPAIQRDRSTEGAGRLS